ncbi:MAG: MotA/TolQ/ExbB proton channel family protein [uncultured Paraburkholderia sp.]|nr:MAG: MotA/TolQ/ExbB proton channel family protein [uncultured Paraburkholderia sp.]CAH2943683.1 MAG: MotA/TolQ/ExbB proton channel family protein [uncultured Paraburkholderia sp.]
MAGSSGVIHYLKTSDAITHGVAYVLLAMSITSWCFLIVKSWILTRAKRQAMRSFVLFWQVPTLSEGVAALRRADRERVLCALRQALNASQRRLEFGQVLLASVGSTAPFVCLLGTVWGIYHALDSIAASGQAQIENVAGPVGEALIMTAFGLVVAIPAVLAYNNVLGCLVWQLSEELDGFAHDLHAYVCAPAEQAAPVRHQQASTH